MIGQRCRLNHSPGRTQVNLANTCLPSRNGDARTKGEEHCCAPLPKASAGTVQQKLLPCHPCYRTYRTNVRHALRRSIGQNHPIGIYGVCEHHNEQAQCLRSSKTLHISRDPQSFATLRSDGCRVGPSNASTAAHGASDRGPQTFSRPSGFAPTPDISESNRLQHSQSFRVLLNHTSPTSITFSKSSKSCKLSKLDSHNIH